MTYIPGAGLSWEEIKSMLETEGSLNKQYDLDADGLIENIGFRAVTELPTTPKDYEVVLHKNAVKFYDPNKEKWASLWYLFGYDRFDNNGGGVWTKYINISITTSPSEYAQYKVVIDSNNVTVYSANGTQKAQGAVADDFWANVKSDGSDIRVFDQAKEQLYFWIEKFDYSNKKAVIWVKLEAGLSELNIAYGNPNAITSSFHNPKQVFEKYDDFEDGVIDSMWTKETPVGDITESGGILTISIPEGANGDWWGGATENAPIIYTTAPSGDWVAVVELKPYTVSTSTWAGIMLYDDRDNAVLCGRFRADPTNRFQVGKIIADTGYNNQGYYESTTLPALLKIEKVETTKKYYVSVDNGQTWNLMYSSTELNGNYIGLFAKNWGQLYAISSPFDNFIVLKNADPANFETPQIVAF